MFITKMILPTQRLVKYDSITTKKALKFSQESADKEYY